MSLAIKLAAGMHATNQTIGGVSGVFLAGWSLNTTEYSIPGCVVAQSLGGFYYDFKPHTGSDVYLDATELVASVQTVSGLGSGVLLAAVAGQGGTPSVDANGNAANLYQCSLNGGSGVRGRSGVS